MNRCLTYLDVVFVVATVGCEPDIIEPPGDPPLPANGFQIKTPAFTLTPGEEAFKCYYTSALASTDIAVKTFKSWVTPGSHHFTLYTTTTPLRPTGRFEDCSSDIGIGGDPSSAPVWLYSSRDPVGELDMPPGVAMPLKAHQAFIFNMHYVNVTSAPITAHVTLNFEYATGPHVDAGAFVTFNTTIAIPPEGTQTVEGHCAPPAGVHFFRMSTHSHKFTTMAAVHLWNAGTIGANLVTTTDWAHPGLAAWAAPYLTLGAGDEIYYMCSYANDTDQTITVGESADASEMCMAVGYYFPATGNTSCIDSVVTGL